MGELPLRWKRTLSLVTAAFILSIFMQFFTAVNYERVQEAKAQEGNGIIRFEGKVPPFIGPYVIFTNPYFGPATPDGTVGVVRSLIVKADEFTSNSDAWTIMHLSFPSENPTGCLQVFGQVHLPSETVNLSFPVCDPSQWDANAWLKWGVALLVVGGFVGPWVAGAIVLFTGILLIT